MEGKMFFNVKGKYLYFPLLNSVQKDMVLATHKDCEVIDVIEMTDEQYRETLMDYERPFGL